MTGAVLAARAQADRVRVAVGADTIAAATLTLFVGVLAILTWGTWGDLDSDTGYDLVAAHRITEGELIFRDFVYYYGPLGPALLALFSLVGGADFSTAFALGLPIALGIVAATYVLARAVVGSLGALLAAAIVGAVAFIPDNYSYVVPHTTNMTLGMLLLLSVLIALWRHSVTGHSRWLAGAGAALGLLTLTKPEPAFAGVAAALVWLLVSEGPRRRAVVLLAVPALLISVMVYGSLLAVVGPKRLLLENLYPTGYLDSAGGVELRNRMPLTIESFVDVGTRLGLYAAGLAAMVGVGFLLSRKGRLQQFVLAGVVLAGLCAVAGSFVNPEALRHGLQFAYGWIPAGVAIVATVVVVSLIRGRRTWTPAEQLSLAGLAALAVLAATVYRGFFPHAPHEQMAAYYMPLAAIFLIRLHLGELARTRAVYALSVAWLAFLALAGAGLTLNDAHAEGTPVSGAGGSISETRTEAPLYQTALRWINRSTKPGDKIFVAPMLTGLYPLSQRWSPVDEISMLPGALPDREAEERAIEALDRAGVRLVITDDRTWPGYDHGAFGESFDQTLSKWISTEFRLVETFTVPSHDSFEGFKPERKLFLWTRRGT